MKDSSKYDRQQEVNISTSIHWCNMPRLLRQWSRVRVRHLRGRCRIIVLYCKSSGQRQKSSSEVKMLHCCLFCWCTCQRVLATVCTYVHKFFPRLIRHSLVDTIKKDCNKWSPECIPVIEEGSIQKRRKRSSLFLGECNKSICYSTCACVK